MPGFLEALLAKLGMGVAGEAITEAGIGQSVNIPGAGLITGEPREVPRASTIPTPVPIIELLNAPQTPVTGRRGRIDRPGILSQLLQNRR